MQSPITNREFLLQVAESLLQHIEEGNAGEVEAPLAALEGAETEPAPAAAVSSAIAEALDAERSGPLQKPKSALEAADAPTKPYFPSNRVLSLIQSAYDEYREEQTAGGELEVPFDTTDPGWLTVAAQKVWALLRGKRPFIKHQQVSDFRFDLPENAVVALYSDWGTGEPTAQRVMQQIRAANPTHCIHLGDVYYSGTPNESRKRFLDVLEQLGPPSATCRHFALNSNHEMYSGGYGYFDTTLAHFRQPASYFNLRNRFWKLIGLDSGYEDFGLKDPQRDWLKAQLDLEGRSILLSHHQAFSAYESRASDRRLMKKTVDLLPKVFAWFWGHEHKCIIYEDFMGIKGRCIGHGAIPESVPYGAPPFDAPVKKVDERPDQEGNCLHGFVLLRFNGPVVDVSYVDEFGGVFFDEQFTAPGVVETVAGIPGPRREESLEVPARRSFAAHYKRLLGARDGSSGLESFTEAMAEPDLSSSGIKDRVGSTREQLHDIVRQFLDDDADLHDIADQIAAQGGQALERLEGEQPEDLDPDELAMGLEVIVRTDGSRPSFMVQQGKVNLATSPAGTWSEQIKASEADGMLVAALTCVGRIDVPGTSQGFMGTGFLVADNVIVTNRHVLQAVARQTAQGDWVFKPGVAIDFGHEFRGVASINPRPLQRVLYAAARTIGPSIDHAKLDMVLIELGPAAGGAPPASVLAVDISPDWAQAGEFVYIAGYPGNPGLEEPLTLQELLFQKTFGCKRVAPGEIMLPNAQVANWTTAHDASTLGGNSGSVVLSAGREGAAAALHYGGTRATPRENWGHVLGRVLAEPDKASGKPLREVMLANGVKLVDRSTT